MYEGLARGMQDSEEVEIASMSILSEAASSETTAHSAAEALRYGLRSANDATEKARNGGRALVAAVRYIERGLMERLPPATYALEDAVASTNSAKDDSIKTAGMISSLEQPVNSIAEKAASANQAAPVALAEYSNEVPGDEHGDSDGVVSRAQEDVANAEGFDPKLGALKAAKDDTDASLGGITEQAAHEAAIYVAMVNDIEESKRIIAEQLERLRKIGERAIAMGNKTDSLHAHLAESDSKIAQIKAAAADIRDYAGIVAIKVQFTIRAAEARMRGKGSF